MQAVEFESRLERGQIAVPAGLRLAEGLPVRVLILLDEPVETEKDPLESPKSILERTAGAWQGSPLERDSQGEYERRIELE